LHGEIGTASTESDTKEKELSLRVLAQLLHLYDDSNEAAKWDGKLKTIVSPSVWNAIQEQLASELCVARKDRKEKKTRIAERAAAINITSPWLNSSRRHGGIEPVQGLGFALR
jgi:tRNA uridine 5-carbamoylmethylation protein Kti12